MKIGTRKRCSNIRGRSMELFDEPEDIKWALEVHVKQAVKNNFKPVPLNDKTCKAVIITGNEDCPDSVWATLSENFNHLNTIYTLIGGNETEEA